MEFETKKDSGRLLATQSKLKEVSPDYWGEIAIDMKNMTNVRIENGLHIVKISGWKRKSKAGTTYLSLAVNRFVPESAGGTNPAKNDSTNDDDVPF